MTIREHEVGKLHLACMRIEGSRTDSELAQSHEAYKQLLLAAQARGLRHLGILDLSASGALNARQRALQANFNREIEPLLRSTCLGFAFVTTSIVIRGMMTAVFWLSEMPTPHAVFPSVEQASSWLFEQAEQHGLRLARDERAACIAKFASMHEAA